MLNRIQINKAPLQMEQKMAYDALQGLGSTFRSLCSSLSVKDLQQKSSVTKRSVGGVLAHIVFSTRMLSLPVHYAQKGKPIPTLITTPLGNLWSYKLSEWQAKKSLEAYVFAFDKTQHKLEKLISSLEPEDWQKSTFLPPPIDCPVMVDTVFTMFAPLHARAHIAEIKESLGQAAQGETYHGTMLELIERLREKGSASDEPQQTSH